MPTTTDAPTTPARIAKAIAAAETEYRKTDSLIHIDDLADSVESAGQSLHLLKVIIQNGGIIPTPTLKAAGEKAYALSQALAALVDAHRAATPAA